MDIAIFYGIQKLAGFSPIIDGIGIFCASVLIWIEAAAIVVFYLRAHRHRMLAVFSAFISGLAAWAVSIGIGLVYFRPRPFAVLENAQLLIGKSPFEKSFPSDHATVAFALACAVYFVDRRWGGVFLAVAVMVALGRVFVGVHYPSDIVAGALLGFVCAFLVHRLIHRFLHTKHHPI
jgi:undecaprenyl-diphosphatase